MNLYRLPPCERRGNHALLVDRDDAGGAARSTAARCLLTIGRGATIFAAVGLSPISGAVWGGFGEGVSGAAQ